MPKLNLQYLGTAHKGDRKEVSRVTQGGFIDLIFLFVNLKVIILKTELYYLVDNLWQHGTTEIILKRQSGTVIDQVGDCEQDEKF